jgi:hypothetical protein
MLRRLSIELKRSIAESITICALYLENKVEDSMKKKCDEVLGEAKKEWIKSFQKVLFSVSSELSLPDTILLTVDKDVAPWFVDAIKNEEFHEYALTERDFKIIELDASFFHSALLFEGNVARNPFIMIDVLASLRKNKV